MAIDRVGRIIEVPRLLCIRVQPWLQTQSASALNAALHGPAIIVDVFATFVPCTSGVTPCFATQDDYSATDAFSANRLLDSFAMQLVLRTEQTPLLPVDPWSQMGPITTPPSPPAAQLQTLILQATSGPGAPAPFGSGAPAVEIPAQGVDPSSVFLARITIPATPAAAAPGGVLQPPVPTLSSITIDNSKRLFLYPMSLVARWIGLSSGTQP
jgi:hypothetical protein